MQGRSVTLVLTTPQAQLIGQTPPFEVDGPWWQEVDDVVHAARARFGIRICVLRLLASERPRPPGGWVAYLAETEDTPAHALHPVRNDLALRANQSSPHRAAWAHPGGHCRSLAWVRAVWPDGGGVQARQRRAWNLSSLWQLQPEREQPRRTAWLKEVPVFLAHEAAVLTWLGVAAPGVAPRLLASDGAGRAVLEHVDGDDCYGAPADQRAQCAQVQHRVQLTSIPAMEALARLGIPDRRGVRLAQTLRARLSGRLSSLPRAGLFLENLDSHIATIGKCGIPDTLVHGDLHPGNVRRDGATITLLDWGDSFLGCPAFDILRLSEGASRNDAAALLGQWSALWKQQQKDSEPERAIALIRPLVPLLAAATYAHFVEQIEESERPFHAFDVAEQLELAERILADGEHSDQA